MPHRFEENLRSVREHGNTFNSHLQKINKFSEYNKLKGLLELVLRNLTNMADKKYNFSDTASTDRKDINTKCLKLLQRINSKHSNLIIENKVVYKPYHNTNLDNDIIIINKDLTKELLANKINQSTLERKAKIDLKNAKKSGLTDISPA